ncbi:MAG TPA: HDOD domain-containing protein [Planctomycetaceae bacterium]|nr:HDOD domain-containing protein [Planctomycetaceae bacterium]
MGTSLINWKHIRAQALGNEPPEELPPQVKLPMLPHAVTEFSKRADDPNASSRELGAIVETDTGLTCELLKYVNSALFGLRKKAASAQQAISLLGVRQSKLFLLTTGIKVALSSRESKLVNFRAFWAANLERALFAREVAKLLNADADLAFAAAMMQDSLLPVITTEMCDLYMKYCALEDDDAPDLAQFEQKKLGWDHPLATAYIMWAWNFPDDLLCCILFHHDGFSLLQDTALADTAAAAVAVASLLPDPLRQVRHGLRQLTQLSEKWPEFDLLAIAAQVEAHVAALSPGTSMELSLLRRCEKMFADMAETADTVAADTHSTDCTV